MSDGTEIAQFVEPARSDNTLRDTSLSDATLPSRGATSNPITITNNTDNEFSSTTITSTAMPTESFSTIMTTAEVSEERRELAAINAAVHNNIYNSTSYKAAISEIIELADTPYDKISAERINGILARIQQEHISIKADELLDLIPKFQKAHYESRQQLLNDNIEQLGREHAKDYKLNPNSSLNYETEVKNLVSSYQDLFSIRIEGVINLNAENLTESYQQNFANEAKRIEVQEQQKLERHIETMAKNQALRYFRNDPGKKISNEVINHQLEALLERYPGAVSDNPVLREKLEQKIAKLYSDTYNNTYQKEYQTLGAWDKFRFGANSWMISKTNGIKNFTKSVVKAATNIVKAVDAIGDVFVDSVVNITKAGLNLAIAIPESALNVVTKSASTISSIASSIYNFEYSKIGDMASKVWDGTKAIASTLIPLAKGAFLATLELGWGALKLTGSALWAVGKGAWNLVTDIENWKTLGSLAGQALLGLGKGALWLANPVNLFKVAKGAWNIGTNVAKGIIGVIAAGWELGGMALSKTYEFLSKPENIVKICNGAIALLRAPDQIISGTLNLAATVLRDPKAAYEQVVNTYNKIKPFLAPVGRFLHQVGEDMGINDMLFGAKALIGLVPELGINSIQAALNLARNMKSVINGEMTPEQYAENFKQDINKLGRNLRENIVNSRYLVTGAVKCALELTGVKDIYHMTKALIAGDYPTAAMYAVFSAGTIWATATAITTGGASIASMQAYKAAAKAAIKKTLSEGTEVLGKNLFKETSETVYQKLGVKVVGEKATKETIEKAGKKEFKRETEQAARDIADKGILELNEKVQKEGIEVLNEETVENLIEKISKEHGAKLYEDLGIKDAAEKASLEFLEKTHKKSIKEITDVLVKSGIKPKQANKIAKKLKKVLKNGSHDDILRDELTDLIEAGFKEHIEQDVKIFQDRFRKLLLDQTDELAEATSKELKNASKQLREALEAKVKDKAKKTGKEVSELVDDLANELTEAAGRGYTKGMKNALRKVIKEGVEEAIKKFRARVKKRIRTDGRDSNYKASNFKESKTDSKVEPVEAKSVENKIAEDKKAINREDSRTRTIVGKNGETILLKEILGVDDKTWTLVSKSVEPAKNNSRLSLRGKNNSKKTTTVA
jgi:hypothetical protein